MTTVFKRIHPLLSATDVKDIGNTINATHMQYTKIIRSFTLQHILGLRQISNRRPGRDDEGRGNQESQNHLQASCGEPWALVLSNEE